MTLFHITEDGPKICRAKGGNCPISKSGPNNNNPHFANESDAQKFYEESIIKNNMFRMRKRNSRKVVSHLQSHDSEFYTINESFPSQEIISKYNSIVEKYGKENLYQTKSLVDNEELFNNPSELFLLYSFMNAQQKSSAIEKFIYKKLGGEKVKSSDDKGDAKINGEYYELKTSTTNKGDNLNIRQIRLYQDVDYYICSYIKERDLINSRIYKLTKEEMIEEVSKIGGFTHGTKKANENKINPEYSITVNVYNENNENTRRWNDKYWYNDLYNMLKDQGELL